MAINDSSLGTSTHILNHIAVDFTKFVSVEALLPYLLAHHMLTRDETYILHSSSIPPTKQNRELLQFLKQKGSETLQKLLCCLTKETTHWGHRAVAAKLRATMEMFEFSGKLVCPVCKKLISNSGKQLHNITIYSVEETVLLCQFYKTLFGCESQCVYGRAETIMIFQYSSTL